MPIVERDVRAAEQSTVKVTATLKDSQGATVSAANISALTWSLLLSDGTIVNSRDAVAVSPIANPATIVLSGDDWRVSSGYLNRRYLLLEGTYTSDEGSGLPAKETVELFFDDLVGVT